MGRFLGVGWGELLPGVFVVAIPSKLRREVEGFGMGLAGMIQFLGFFLDAAKGAWLDLFA